MTSHDNPHNSPMQLSGLIHLPGSSGDGSLVLKMTTADFAERYVGLFFFSMLYFLDFMIEKGKVNSFLFSMLTVSLFRSKSGWTDGPFHPFPTSPCFVHWIPGALVPGA